MSTVFRLEPTCLPERRAADSSAIASRGPWLLGGYVPVDVTAEDPTIPGYQRHPIMHPTKFITAIPPDSAQPWRPWMPTSSWSSTSSRESTATSPTFQQSLTHQADRPCRADAVLPLRCHGGRLLGVRGMETTRRRPDAAVDDLRIELAALVFSASSDDLDDWQGCSADPSA